MSDLFELSGYTVLAWAGLEAGALIFAHLSRLVKSVSDDD